MNQIPPTDLQKSSRPPIADLRCVSVRGRLGSSNRSPVTIDEALSCLSGHLQFHLFRDEEPAIECFLRTGSASSPHATYCIQGTPEERAERLTIYRQWRDFRRKFSASETEPDFLAAQGSRQTG